MREDFVPASELKEVMRYIREVWLPTKTFSMTQIYKAIPGDAYPLISEGVSDHAMYVALSRLVKAGEVGGLDPYAKSLRQMEEEGESWNHNTAVYSTP